MKAAVKVVGMDHVARDRFWRFVDRSDPDGCWLWTGSTRPASSGEYGRFWLDDRSVAAHRVAYVEQVGPIPAGAVIHHRCETRLCVRGDHLTATTVRANLHASDTPARRNAAKTQCPRGHPYSGDNLYVPPAGGERQCRRCRHENTMRARRARR